MNTDMKVNLVISLMIGMVCGLGIAILLPPCPPEPTVVGLTVPCSLTELERRRDILLDELSALEGY